MNKKQRQAAKRLDNLEREFERELIRNYQISLKELRSKIAKIYQEYDGDWYEMQKYNRLSKLEKEIAKEIGKLTGKNAQTLKKSQRHIYEEGYYQTAYILSDAVNADLGFALLDKDEIERAIENPLDRIGFLERNRDNQQRLTRQLRENLAQGLIQGESFRSTAKRIKERMDVGASKALTIARTENHRVREQSRHDGMVKASEAGLRLKKVWIAAQQDRTREAHSEADGQERYIDEPFEVDGEELMYPGDPSGSADNVINCRCDMLEVPDGFESNASAVQNVSYDSYDDFKSNLSK
ncbi:phage minor head protein [Sediminibacillus massiliensis]|uniref:phage head morphogenesis protein n=1 Tax=Sediminibacillus massiliensis TaxID=1926277 RepID=UPI0009886C2B|nr:phage minor head protein [Sediminibacillus massiliensis]